jgi:hypothetical protein
MKPDYVEAAKAIGDEGIVAAIDVNRPENSGVRKKYNITGFPTLLYFRFILQIILSCILRQAEMRDI